MSRLQDVSLQERARTRYKPSAYCFLMFKDEARIKKLQLQPDLRFSDPYLPLGKVAGIGCGLARGLSSIARRGPDLLAVGLAWGRRSWPAAACRNLRCRGVQRRISPYARRLTRLPRTCAQCALGWRDVTRRLPTQLMLLLSSQPHRHRVCWLVDAALPPLRYLVHQFNSRGNCSLRGVRSFSCGCLFMPHAIFHACEMIEAWAGKSYLFNREIAEDVGNVHASFLMKGASCQQGKRE